MLVWAGGIGFGWLLWTNAEYLGHRFLMHRLGRGPLATEHAAHHRDQLATSLLKRSLAYGLVLVAALLVGWATVPAVALGLAWGYTLYEIVHWRSHHRLPHRAEVRLRIHHFHHHHGHPGANFGFTTRLWDRVFGTLVEPTVPTPPEPLVLTGSVR